MNKIQIISFTIIEVLLICVIPVAKSQVVVWEKYYDNGEIWTRVIKNADSSYIEYSFSRINRDYCVSKGDFSRDTFLLSGLCSCYYNSGVLKSISNFKNGKQDGKIIDFYLDGTLKKEFFKLKGVMHGEFKEFYSNGKIKVKGYYENNLMIKRWYYFYDNGIVQAEGKYYKKAGHVKPFSINFSDSSCSTENFLPPFEFASEYEQLKKGVWKFYDCKGVLRKKIRF